MSPALSSPARRRGLAVLLLGPVLLAALAGSGCATLNQVEVEVRTFGSWPAGRAPGRYAFERLPSQQEDAAGQEALESAAGAALERAGFARADSAAQADVLVQFGTRQAQVLKPPPNVSIGIGIGMGSPMWRNGGFGWGLYGHHGLYPDDRLREQRELGLLLLDRASHQVLVEVQARHESRYGAGDIAEALFDAALDGFPDLPAGPRKVTVPLPGR